MVVADAGLGANLPRGLDEVEGGHIGAPQRVAEGVAGVGVGGRHRGACHARGGVLRDTPRLNTGALLPGALVRPDPGGSDQPESPSALEARTRAS